MDDPQISDSPFARGKAGRGPRLSATGARRNWRASSGKSDLAKAIRYALNRWPSFTLFLEDGRVAIDNNPAERALRPIALGRKNFLSAGSDAGGEIVADAMTLIETAKLSDLNPQVFLADVLARINDHLISRLDELLPWNWTAQSAEPSKAAA